MGIIGAAYEQDRIDRENPDKKRIADLEYQDRLRESMLGQKRKEQKEEDKLAGFAEYSVSSIHFRDRPNGRLWLRERYKFHRRPFGWIVEGIVIQGKGYAADAFFFSVEILTRDGNHGSTLPLNMVARSVTFNLKRHEWDTRGGGMVDKGEIKILEDHDFPRVDPE